MSPPLSVQQAVIATNLDGRIVAWNGFAEQMFGWRRDEAIGRDHLELTHAAYSDELRHDIKRRIRGGESWSRVVTLLKRDGSTFIASVIESPIIDDDGGVTGILTTVADITDRKNEREELLRREALLSEAQELAQLGSWEVDLVTRTHSWSDETYRILGIEKKNRAPTLEDLLSVVHEHDRQTLIEATQWPFTQGVFPAIDLRLPQPGGEERIVHLRGRNYAETQARPRVAGFVQDVTAARRVQREIQRRSTQQEAVAKLSQSALRGTEVHSLFRMAATLLADILAVDVVDVLRRVAGRAMQVAASAGRESAAGRIILVDERSAVAHALLTGETVVIEDSTNDSRFTQLEFDEEVQARSGMTASIFDAEWVPVGAITVHNRRPSHFSGDAVAFLQAIASVLAQALDRQRADQELKSRAAQQIAMAELGRKALAGVTPELLADGCRIVTELLGMEFTHYAQRTDEGLRIVAGAQWREGPEMVADSPQTQAGFTLRSTAPVIVTDYASETRFDTSTFVEQGIVSGISVAVCGEKRTFGVLSAHSRTTRTFSEAELNFVAAIANVIADALERDAARLALVESEARYRTVVEDMQLLLESTYEAICAIDLRGNCTLANRAAALLLDVDPERLIGMHVHSLIHPGCAGCEIDSVLAGAGAQRVHEATFHRANGMQFPVEYGVAPIVDEGVTKGAVLTFSDITDRRKLEGQLEQAHRVTSLGRLAATIAHEFNNVLMGISPFVELLRRGDQSFEKRLTALEHIGKSVKRGKRVSDEILRYTNPSEPVMEPVALQTWSESFATELRSILGPKYDLQVELPDPSLKVVADASQMHQIFTNLVLNARDAMPDGGPLRIALTSEPSGSEFPFGVIARPEEFVHIRVEDKGCGIAPNVLRHIFEPLFTTKRTGTGLGLAVTHQVVKRHGGDLFVESTPGIGSTFHIFLPRAQQAEEERPAAQAVAAGRSKGLRRVLLVEDEPAVASGVALLLEIEGIAVDIVDNGAGVMAAIENTHPDAVVLDIGLPDIDGTQVYAAIAVRYPNLPVVFSTGHGDAAQLESYLNKEHVGFLMKPYDIDRLLESLQKVTSA